MKDLIEEFKTLIEADISTYTTQQKQEYYSNLRNDIDKIMGSQNIKFENYEKLLEVKKIILAKIYNLNNK